MSDGQFDVTFGTNGIRTWNPFNIYGNYTQEAKLLDDGKIIMAGYLFYDNGTARAFAVRLNADGTDDTTFGSNGCAVIEDAGNNVVEALAIQSDGKLVLVGYKTVEGPHDMMLVIRLSPDGQLDSSFGTNGILSFSIPDSPDANAYNVDVQSDGKIVVFGTHSPQNSSQRSVVVRLNPDGSFDTSFGEKGVFTLLCDKDAANYLYDLKISSDSKLYGMGHITDNVYSNLVVVSLTLEGKLNNAFDGDGVAFVDLDGGVATSRFLEIQPDGKLLAGGWFSPKGDYYHSFPIVARLHTKSSVSLNETVSECVDFAYPNPTSGLLKFNLANDESVYQAKVYDMTGRVVMNKQIAAQGTMDVSALQSGSYFIQLVSDKETLVNRFVKE